ncbi:glycosyltransferase, partial [Candidatus Bathyarchaeota archaeon]|nr:glycosyltransferase [Candidatus Bathyarchaeota archaeon]
LIPRLRLHLKKIIVLSMGKRYGGGSRIKRLLRRLFPSPEYDGNVEYHYSPMIFVPLFEFLQVPLALFYALVMLAVRRIKVDAIYCITVGEPYFVPVALIISSILRLPLILEHGDPFWEEVGGLKRKAYQLYQRLAMHSTYVKYVTAVDPSVVSFLRVRYPWKSVLFLPEGYPDGFDVEVNENDKDSLRRHYGLKGKKVVMYAGTLFSPSIPIKSLLDAAAEVIRQRNDVVFVIFGRDSHKLSPLISSMQLSEHFLLGYRPHNEMGLWISLADVCVNIRRGFCFGHKVHEYMIKGKPMVLATENPMKYDHFLIDEHNCLLVRLEPETLSKAILRLIDNGEFAHEIGKNAHESIKMYSWDFFTKVLIRMFKSVIRNGSKIARE